MSTSEQTEIERKYDVDDEAVVPDLEGVTSVAGGAERVLEAARVDRAAPVRLRAVYHDTDDHLLLRSRITLRRRTGGHDEGWHLKLPAAPAPAPSPVSDPAAAASGQDMSSESPGTTGTDHSATGSTAGEPDGSRGRREVHAPLGSEDEGVPAELLSRVEEQLGGRPVGPVIVLETTRTATTLVDTAGAALAELADDVVTATVTGGTAGADEGGRGGAGTGTEPVVRRWREWEAELAPGIDGPSGDALLDAIEARLLAAGAVPSTSRSKLARGLGAEPH